LNFFIKLIKFIINLLFSYNLFTLSIIINIIVLTNKSIFLIFDIFGCSFSFSFGSSSITSYSCNVFASFVFRLMTYLHKWSISRKTSILKGLYQLFVNWYHQHNHYLFQFFRTFFFILNIEYICLCIFFLKNNLTFLIWFYILHFYGLYHDYYSYSFFYIFLYFIIFYFYSFKIFLL